MYLFIMMSSGSRSQGGNGIYFTRKYLLTVFGVLIVSLLAKAQSTSCTSVVSEGQEFCEKKSEDIVPIMSDTPKFGYWDIRGLGQPIRLLLAYLKINVDEKRYPNEESDVWYSVKGTLGLPFPNLPYFMDGATKVTESRAIMKYICRTRKPEMVGKTLQEQTDIDIIDNLMYDLFYVHLVPLCYEPTEAKQKEFKENVEPLKLGYVDKFLNGRQWMAGDTLTYVDFFAYEVVRGLRVYDNKAIDNFPNLKAFLEKVENLPEIKKYMESEKYLEKPIFTADAAVKI